MSKWILGFLLLGLGACASNSKNGDFSRMPAAAEPVLAKLEFQGELPDFKLLITGPLELKLVKDPFFLPWSSSGDDSEMLKSPYGTSGIAPNYAIHFQDGKIYERNFKPHKSAREFDSFSPVCSLLYRGPIVGNGVSSLEPEVTEHFASGGGWDDRLLRKFRIPQSANIELTPRALQAYSIGAITSYYIQERTNIALNLGIYPRAANTKEIVFDAQARPLGFQIYTWALANVSSKNSLLMITCRVSDYGNQESDQKDVREGRWSEIMAKAFGSYMTVGKLNLKDISTRPALLDGDYPAVPPTKMEFKNVPKKEALPIGI